VKTVTKFIPDYEFSSRKGGRIASFRAERSRTGGFDPKGCGGHDRGPPTALAGIELTARQIVDPERTQLHRDELAVILRDVDPVMVAVEVAVVLAGVVPALIPARAVDRG
jgi:hypothetical protein